MESIRNYVLENGGCTLNENLEIQELTSGFMVSVDGFEIVATMDELEDAIEYELQQVNEQLGECYIGLWLNGDALYVDISKRISNLNDAMELGVLNNQLAIFDNANKQVIELIERKGR